jgi:hypothetical protein
MGCDGLQWLEEETLPDPPDEIDLTELLEDTIKRIGGDS